MTTGTVIALGEAMFAGEVHPYTAEYPILPDDELADLAADIAENGLRNPLTVDKSWRLIDGQNRLAACELAGVEPVFEVLDFVDDAAVAAFVSSKNDRRRSQSPGVRWMRVGKALKRQGKRRNGRWETGTFKRSEFGLSDDSARQRLNEVGLILDVAERAETFGDDFAVWSDLPKQVETGEMKLSAAHRIAQDFEAKAAMVELLAYQPLTNALGQLEELANEIERNLPLPQIVPNLRRSDRDRLNAVAKQISAAASTIRTHAREAK